MNETALIAFVVMPAIVVAIGYVVLRLHECEARRLAHGGRTTEGR